MRDPAVETRRDGEVEQLRPWLRWYIVLLFSLAYFFSYTDRMALSLLVEEIKFDLAITDFEISLLQGLAFAIFYAVMGLPLGRLADSVNRKRLMAACVGLWSIMTALCGIARGFGSLFLFRIGVGVGEAGLSPTAYSISSDLFPKHRLGRISGLFAMGAFVGGGGGLILVGAVLAFFQSGRAAAIPVIGSLAPWRLTMMTVGLAGLIVAALILFTVPEPARQAAASETKPSLRETMRLLWTERGFYLPFLLGTSLCSQVTYGSAAWAPAFFMRTYHWRPDEVAAAYGVANLCAALAGPIAGGLLLDRVTRGVNIPGAFTLGMGLLVLTVALAVAPLMAVPAFALLFFSIGIFAKTAFGVIPPTVTQLVAAPRMRGQLVAVYVFAANIVGLTVGPSSIAIVTDKVFGDPQAIGKAMALVAGVSLPLAFLLFAVARRAAKRRGVSLMTSPGPSLEAEGDVA